MCIFSLFSCNQEDDYEVIQTSKTYFHVNVENTPQTKSSNGKSKTDSIGTLRFTYKGDSYESKVLFNEDKTIILDEHIANVFEELKQKKDVAIFANEDGSLDFYNSYDEMNSCRKWKEKMSSNTRGGNNDYLYIQSFKLRVWKDAKGRKKGGPSVEWVLATTDNTRTPETFYIGGEKPQLTPIGQPDYPVINRFNDNLWKYNMDNEISSCQIWATTAKGGKVPYIGLAPGQLQHANVTFYDNNDCTGRSLTFSEVSINYTYSQIDYFSSLGFNDITSSIKISFDNSIN